MRLGRPIIGSLIAHAVVVAVVAPLVRGPTNKLVVPAEAEAEAVEVELVTGTDREPAAGNRQPAIGTPRVTAKVPRSQVRQGALANLAPWHLGGNSPSSDTRLPDHRLPGGSLYMHMRGPELRLSDAEADRILDHPLEPVVEVPKSGRLQSAPGGRGVIPDAVTVVTVERDGTAHFHDKRDIDIRFHLPTLPPITERELRATKEELGKALRDWYADPEKIARGAHATDLPEHLKAEPGQCDAWGNKMCEPEPMPPPQTIVSGKLDLTAYLMRKLGVGDPFASRKRALLDATFAERADRGGRFRGEQLERSAELVRRTLEGLWANTTDPKLRREALFELWDECAEGEGPLGEAGQRARAEVIGWIGAHLPRGSAGAYGDEELAALGRRRTSKQTFEPYPKQREAVVESDDVGSAGSAR